MVEMDIYIYIYFDSTSLSRIVDKASFWVSSWLLIAITYVSMILIGKLTVAMAVAMLSDGCSHDDSPLLSFPSSSSAALFLFFIDPV